MKTVASFVFETDFADIITRFAAEVSPELSVRFENRMVEAWTLIAKQPEIGRVRKDLKQSQLRSFRIVGFDSYLIFYQVRAHDVFFVRLLHGAMDLPAMFPEA